MNGYAAVLANPLNMQSRCNQTAFLKMVRKATVGCIVKQSSSNKEVDVGKLI
jgi:hypothetical protein